MLRSWKRALGPTLVGLGVAAACTGTLQPLDRQISGDDDDSLPDGGAAAITFVSDIQADMDAKGCTAVSCHGSDSPAIPMHTVANATNPVDLRNNHANVQPLALDGENSDVLKKNLQGSGLSHVGGVKFTSTDDPIYQKWLLWIRAGAPLGDADGAIPDAGAPDAGAGDAGL